MSDPYDVRAELAALRTEVARLAAELTEMRAQATLLEGLAREDPLTGLLNRRGLFRELARAAAYRARYGTPIALLLVDLDGFKAINDRFGHAAGDRALVHVATVIRGTVRASDSVGRLGGDEFAVILWQATEEVARRKAEGLEAAIIAAPVAVGAATVRLGASVGATLLRPDDTPEEALSRSDRAMYRRKHGRAAGPDD